MGSLIFKEDLTAIKQPFIFIIHKRHCEYVKGKLSKIGLAFILILPVLYDIKILILINKYAISGKVFLKVIN